MNLYVFEVPVGLRASQRILFLGDVHGEGYGVASCPHGQDSFFVLSEEQLEDFRNELKNGKVEPVEVEQKLDGVFEELKALKGTFSDDSPLPFLSPASTRQLAEVLRKMKGN